jgi:hypothetical protein
MSAECEKHGCDLVGHQFSDGGIQCPQCVLEAKLDAAQRELTDARIDRDLHRDVDEYLGGRLVDVILRLIDQGNALSSHVTTLPQTETIRLQLQHWDEACDTATALIQPAESVLEEGK